MHVAIILAAGDQRRWNGPGIKQLMNIGGESVLARQLRQAKRIADVTIVMTHRPEIVVEANSMGVHTATPERNAVLAETLLSSAEFWSDRTTILLGDVVFARYAIDRVLQTVEPVMFFGRADEMFALTFNELARDRVREVVQQVVDLNDAGKGRGKLVNCHRVYAGFEVTERKYDPGCYTVLKPPTRDLDRHRDYVGFFRRVVETGKLCDMPS
jgi:choline kinase